ncbi:SusC/RagA family TonB-linked outer membrane protein [Sphingobacterium bambusae]|uniref:SusC/RagA family TonB-linked outer membrane protein n=1 Tax=Sphingobacterium bambusae TaxID=662858 RepID=A0ABW6BLW1_9SPHI|nr:SusC/RagA family TonB-linked outer membrane protein [Sphingobacterium bambusae]WPL50957.1 SusC/RagA family TonB-linked outer membrane protein [Sphingobacterium bambusae]
MKLTAILVALFSLQGLAAVHGQRLSLHVNGKSVKTVLYEIQRKTGYDFLYSSKTLDHTKPVTLHMDNAALQQVLDACMAGQPLAYEINDGTVFIKRKSPSERSAVSQQRTVLGEVKSATGELLPGVTIVADGSTKRSTTTDMQGKFSLVLDANSKFLTVSNIGYHSQRISLGNDGVLSIILEEEVGELDEVVVVGYGELKKKEITSAISSVKAKDFNPGSARSPMELIQGKVAGLNITREQGNNPNSGASIQLRGVTSISGDKSPLIVIDGIPGGNLDLLQQDDIESFDVLKDGSAAAIYGTRANAGVILITTKKGRAGEPTFNYSTYVQKDFVNKRPDLLSASEYRNIIATTPNTKAQDLGADTDMYNALINTGNASHYHNLSASGGTDKANYRAALFYNDLQGIAKENSREQVGGRLNINQKGLQGKLELQVNMVANFNKANLLGGSAGDFEQAVKWNPTAPIYKEDGTFYEMQENYNPIGKYANQLNQRDQQTFSGDARLTAHLTDYLSAAMFGSYLRDNWNNRAYRSMNDWGQRVGTSWNGLGFASKGNELNWSKTFEPTLNFKKTFAEQHSVSAVAGYSYQYNTRETFGAENNGFTTDGFLDWNLGAGSAINDTRLPRPGVRSFKDDNTLIAVFGRVNYSFADKYFVQAILRREGSSRFGINNKWGNFPAASIGWNIAQEDFMQDVGLINDLKFRMGFGVTGNQGVGNYQSLTTLSTGGVYPQEGVYYQTYGPSRNVNPDLRWERKEEWNMGLDFSVLDSRISGSLDVYRRDTKDLLYQYAVQQPSFVHTNLWYNVGTIRNSGVELTLNAFPVRNDHFQWEVNLTANSQFNKLTQLSSETFKVSFISLADIPNPGAMGPAIRLEEGGTVGNFYGKRFAQFSEDGQWMFYKADGSIVPSGEVTEQDWTILGNGMPKYVLGLNQRFSYKGFDLSMLIRGKFGFDILNLPEVFYGNTQYLPNNIYNSALSRHNALNAAPMYSDYYIERGDFVRLDNMTLAYTFNLKSAYLKNLRTYVSGRNLFTITGYSGLDPEIRDTGLDPGVDARGFYPRTQSWTVGLNIGF